MFIWGVAEGSGREAEPLNWGGVSGSEESAITFWPPFTAPDSWLVAPGSGDSNIEMMQNRAEPAIMTGWENFIDELMATRV